MLLPSPTRPLVSEVSISEPPGYLLEGDPDELRLYWRDRLAMTLDEQGNARPVAEQSLNLNGIGAALSPGIDR